MPKLLECFAGSRSVGKVAETFGMDVFSIDIKGFEKINLVADMEFVKVEDIPFVPDVFLKLNPNMKFFIENPVGMLRKMPFMKKFDRVTVTYCRYGDKRMKPTDIWTNHMAGLFNPEGWRPLPMCWNGNRKCHHEPAPRGSQTGTQGLKNDYERSKIPPLLIKEILNSV